MTKSKKNNFFFIHFLDESEPSESKKSSAQFFFFLRKLLTFSTFFLRPKPSTRPNMAYMKFEKKMLGGSDFFLDFLGPDLAKILGFGALRGQFWTIEIQKTPKLFRRPAGPQKGGPPPLNPRLIQVLKALGTKKICHFLFENGKNGKNQGSFSSSFHIYMTMP